MRKSVAYMLCAYLLGAFFTYGAANAEMKWHREKDWTSLHQEWRDEAGFVIGWSLLPLAPLVVLFVTNGLQHGWTLSTETDKSLWR